MASNIIETTKSVQKRSNEEVDPEEEGEEVEEDMIVEKEEVYDKIKSKIEILDIKFHPTENNLISLGLINGKLRM